MASPTPPYSQRRSTRLRGYDYRQSGVYFVTICTYMKTKLFGTIIDGEMALSPLGEIAREEWQRIAEARSNITLDHYVIMPNHLHGLVIISEPQSRSDEHIRDAEIPFRLSAGSLGAIINHYKGAVSRRAWSGLVERSQSIWQRNYYDHIVRDDASLNDIRNYILQNPGRWQEDSLYVV